jgi:ABC-2 type transport system permease protein
MKLIRDTWLIFGRSMASTLHNPAWAVMGLFQPICYMLMFAPFLASLETVPGFPAGGPMAVFTPGALVMLTLSSTAFVGFGLVADLRAGLIERLRVTPVSRLALPLGCALRDVVILVAQALMLLIAASFLGLSLSLSGLFLLLTLLVLLSLMIASISYALALTFRDEHAVATTINFFGLPLLLLSGIILPLAIAPDWIRTVAQFNPFAYVVEAARSVINGSVDAVVFQAFGLLAGLALLALTWASRAFRQATA